jgi:hypothetical protein
MVRLVIGSTCVCYSHFSCLSWHRQPRCFQVSTIGQSVKLHTLIFAYRRLFLKFSKQSVSFIIFDWGFKFELCRLYLNVDSR